MESSNLTTWHKLAHVCVRKRRKEGGKRVEERKRGRGVVGCEQRRVWRDEGFGGKSGISDYKRADISDRRDKCCCVRLVEPSGGDE